ncbi:MAG: DUF2520 domain-containing protein [Desulfuromonadales bacterium]|nr:DUF2520 domain-containing protein [Desulfuromonadales bacterium]NIR33366.1 DUF2520 domain-containing protein [Desulfuromonadales bacterium]NIS39565.1 DUF2520 domain-containing protein [Desulfuromonadales bacterium]
MRFSLIGPGRLGQAVARRLYEAGHEIEAVIGRDLGRAAEAARFIGASGREATDLGAVGESELVLLAVPDDALADVAGCLLNEKLGRTDTVLVHFSGIHCADILLEQAGSAEAGVLSIHPLQTFADPRRGYAALPGTPCAIEGNQHLMDMAERVVEALGGIPFHLESDRKALYHAAACITSNYLVTLVATAEKLLAGCGFSGAEARRLLGPLLQTTARNVAEVGPADALTGPIARGDTQTVDKHLQALSLLAPEQGELYRLLGRLTIEVGLEKGTLSDEAAQALRKRLD